MTTKTIFNMDSALKKKAMKKAREDGLSLSAVLNLALRAYVGGGLRVGAFERSLASGLADVRAGRVISQEDLFKELGL